MLRTTLLIPVLYVVGGVGLTALAWQRLTSDDPARDIALWIVLPVAWWVSFLPAAGGIVALFRVRRMRGMLEKLHADIRARSVGPDTIDEQVEYWSSLVAADNRMPRFLVRGLVRRAVEHAVAQAPDWSRKPYGPTA